MPLYMYLGLCRYINNKFEAVSFVIWASEQPFNKQAGNHLLIYIYFYFSVIVSNIINQLRKLS